MSFNGVGFGHGRFGHFPFGKADYGNSTVTRTFADVLIEKDDDPTGKNQELLHYLSAISDSVNRVKSKIDAVPDQVDFNKVRDDLIANLGSTIGVTIDDVEPPEFRRSLVSSAVLFYRIKGTENSYRVRGKISGFDIDVFNMYKIDVSYVPLFDPEDVYEIPGGTGNWYTDRPPGEVAGTPTEASCDYCPTSSIKLSFTIVKPQPPAVIGQANFTDRVIAKLRDIIPIHVRELLFEIVAVILIDEHQALKAELSSTEMTFTPMGVAHYFDVFTTDVCPMDARMGVVGTATETPV